MQRSVKAARRTRVSHMFGVPKTTDNCRVHTLRKCSKYHKSDTSMGVLAVQRTSGREWGSATGGWISLRYKLPGGDEERRSHFRPVFVHWEQAGFRSSHFLRLTLIKCCEYRLPLPPRFGSFTLLRCHGEKNVYLLACQTPCLLLPDSLGASALLLRSD